MCSKIYVKEIILNDVYGSKKTPFFSFYPFFTQRTKSWPELWRGWRKVPSHLLGAHRPKTGYYGWVNWVPPSIFYSTQRCRVGVWVRACAVNASREEEEEDKEGERDSPRNRVGKRDLFSFFLFCAPSKSFGQKIALFLFLLGFYWRCILVLYCTVRVVVYSKRRMVVRRIENGFVSCFFFST